jgi:PHD/YefM family antitoxin component YafN of YafNO toxin-antitoxin module
MKTFSTNDLLKDIRTVTFAAAKAPVQITQYRKPRFVLMTIEDYERLTHRDPRQVFRTADMPDEIRDEILGAIDKLIGPDDEA